MRLIRTECVVWDNAGSDQILILFSSHSYFLLSLLHLVSGEEGAGELTIGIYFSPPSMNTHRITKHRIIIYKIKHFYLSAVSISMYSAPLQKRELQLTSQINKYVLVPALSD